VTSKGREYTDRKSKERGSGMAEKKNDERMERPGSSILGEHQEKKWKQGRKEAGGDHKASQSSPKGKSYAVRGRGANCPSLSPKN